MSQVLLSLSFYHQLSQLTVIIPHCNCMGSVNKTAFDRNIYPIYGELVVTGSYLFIFVTVFSAISRYNAIEM